MFSREGVREPTDKKDLPACPEREIPSESLNAVRAGLEQRAGVAASCAQKTRDVLLQVR